MNYDCRVGDRLKEIADHLGKIVASLQEKKPVTPTGEYTTCPGCGGHNRLHDGKVTNCCHCDYMYLTRCKACGSVRFPYKPAPP